MGSLMCRFNHTGTLKGHLSALPELIAHYIPAVAMLPSFLLRLGVEVWLHIRLWLFLGSVD